MQEVFSSFRNCVVGTKLMHRLWKVCIILDVSNDVRISRSKNLQDEKGECAKSSTLT